MNVEKYPKNSQKARKILALTSIFCLICISFIAGYSFRDKNLLEVKEKSRPDKVDFSLFWEAWNILEQKSVKNNSADDKTEGAIAGMLASLKDPYTTYFTKEENKRFREDIHGEFFGIGIEIILKEGYPTVVAPIPDMPAEKAGIKSGDIIVEIDGLKTLEIGYDETINKIRGKEGTEANLKIIRAKIESPIDFKVTRSKITVKSVEWTLREYDGEKIQLIKIRQFGDDTETLFEKAVQEVKVNNPDGIIIDLRNNPGGYLESAVNISSYFIKDGLIVNEKGKEGKSRDYNSDGRGGLDSYKIILITNNGSASASEILAGALQDRRGIKVVGEKTFGKGSVQELIDLTDGSALKITVADWFLPNGRQINKEGIDPDLDVVDDESTEIDEQEALAIKTLTS